MGFAFGIIGVDAHMTALGHRLALHPYPRLHPVANLNIRLECYIIIGDDVVDVSIEDMSWSPEAIADLPVNMFHRCFGEAVKNAARNLFRGLEKARNYYGWGEK